MAHDKREQAWVQWEQGWMRSGWAKTTFQETFYAGYDAGHAAATAEAQSDGWVDVADRLPTENGEYDVTLQSVDRPSSEGDSK